MTTPKTAEEIARSIVTEIAGEMTRDIDLEDSVRTAWAALDAYLLQESAPLVEALKSIGNIIGGPTMGYAPDHVQLIEREKMFNKSYEILSKAIEAFQKKHGGVV